MHVTVWETPCDLKTFANNPISIEMTPKLQYMSLFLIVFERFSGKRTLLNTKLKKKIHQTLINWSLKCVKNNLKYDKYTLQNSKY